MKSGRVVLVSCGSLAEARKIARALVEDRLAACVNIFPAAVESIYRWKDKVEVAREYLFLIKTVEGRLKQIEQLIRRLHSYDVPEFVVLPMVSGSKKYLSWLLENASPV